MLELRPNCELCDCNLLPEAANAMICTYECTFCATCATGQLANVCPNCGGGFAARPIRPRKSWRPGKQLGLKCHPAGTTRVHTPYSKEEIRLHVDGIKHLKPDER